MEKSSQKIKKKSENTTTKPKPHKNLTSMANEDQPRDYEAVVKRNTAITTNNHRPTSSHLEKE